MQYNNSAKGTHMKFKLFSRHMSGECEKLLGGYWSRFDIEKKIANPIKFLEEEIKPYCEKMRKERRLWWYNGEKVLFPKVLGKRIDGAVYLQLDIESAPGEIFETVSKAPIPSGPERRKHPRVESKFVVSYKRRLAQGGYDLSHIDNVSQGGIFLVINKMFEKGTRLDMIIRCPLISQKIEVVGEVISAIRKPECFLYETRIKFLNLDKDSFIKLGDFVKEKLKKL